MQELILRGGQLKVVFDQIGFGTESLVLCLKKINNRTKPCIKLFADALQGLIIKFKRCFRRNDRCLSTVHGQIGLIDFPVCYVLNSVHIGLGGCL